MSDKNTQSPSTQLEELLQYRAEIDALDNMLIDTLNKRLEFCQQIGKLKREHQIAVLDAKREEQILQRLHTQSKGPLSATQIDKIYSIIFTLSKETQA